MKLFRVDRLIPKGEKTQERVEAFYVAERIEHVWATLETDLKDEATEVLGIVEVVPVLMVVPDK